MTKTTVAALVAILISGARTPGAAQARAGAPSEPDPSEATAARGHSGVGALPSLARSPLRVGAFTVPLRVMALPIMPGRSVDISLADGSGAALELSSRTGDSRRLERGHWSWTAPRTPGIHPVRVVSQKTDTVDLTFLVLKPATDIRDGTLNGYPIGSYRPVRRSTPLGLRRARVAELPPRAVPL